MTQSQLKIYLKQVLALYFKTVPRIPVCNAKILETNADFLRKDKLGTWLMRISIPYHLSCFRKKYHIHYDKLVDRYFKANGRRIWHRIPRKSKLFRPRRKSR